MPSRCAQSAKYCPFLVPGDKHGHGVGTALWHRHTQRHMYLHLPYSQHVLFCITTPECISSAFLHTLFPCLSPCSTPEMTRNDRTHEYYPPHSSLWLLWESPSNTSQRYPQNQRFHCEAFPVTALERGSLVSRNSELGRENVTKLHPCLPWGDWDGGREATFSTLLFFQSC